MRLNEVIPGRLYLRGEAIGLPADHKAEVLAAEGITLVVNLWSRPDPAFVALAAGLDAEEFRYWHLPMPDGALSAQQRVRLLHTARQITRHLRAGGKALIQCHAGRNRSGLLAALVIRDYEGCTGTEALARIRARRPNAVANQYFAAWIDGLPNAWVLGERA